ncbi:MAG: diguanylate cyclase, partial [Patescibacteria group bacterium]
MLHTPFYDPLITFEDNAANGPFGAFATDEKIKRSGEPLATLFGHKLYQPFGIPAGPVMTSKFVAAAFRFGFDVVVYKTVRSKALKSHPLPNVVPLTIDGNLTIEMSKQPLIAGTEYIEPLTITNSFGVPSADPDWWQADLAKAVNETPKGQLVIGSFQGTKGTTPQAFIDDYATTAKLVAETGAKVLETNLSCPNEGTGHLVCFDVDTTEKIVHAIKTAVPDKPLIVKIAYFPGFAHSAAPTSGVTDPKTPEVFRRSVQSSGEDEMLLAWVKRIGPLVEGISAINTIPAPIVDERGNQALPGQGRLVSG